MYNCAMTAAANAHELEEERAEREQERAENRYCKSITAPYIRYKFDGEWTLDDAERLHAILKIILGNRFQVVMDERLENDTDWAVTGVKEPALWFLNQTLESALTDPEYGPEQAQTDYNNYIGEMQC